MTEQPQGDSLAGRPTEHGGDTLITGSRPSAAPASATPQMPATSGRGGTDAPAGGDQGQIKETASTALAQGKEVAAEARGQISSLADETRQQLMKQSAQQKDKAASSLRQLADELERMANGENVGSGPATQLVQQVAGKAHAAAGWLDGRSTGAMVDELRDLGRRKPGTFLLGALAAGVVAGRLTRGVVDETRDSDSTPESGMAGSPSWGSDMPASQTWGSGMPGSPS